MTIFNSPFPQGFAYRLDSFAVELSLDAAGAIALNTKAIVGDLFFTLSTIGSPRNYIQREYIIWNIQTGTLKYGASFSGSRSQITVNTFPNSDGLIQWDGAVEKEIQWIDGVSPAPGKPGLVWLFRVKDGTVYPANSVITVWHKGRQSSNGIVPVA